MRPWTFQDRLSQGRVVDLNEMPTMRHLWISRELRAVLHLMRGDAARLQKCLRGPGPHALCPLCYRCVYFCGMLAPARQVRESGLFGEIFTIDSRTQRLPVS